MPYITGEKQTWRDTFSTISGLSTLLKSSMGVVGHFAWLQALSSDAGSPALQHGWLRLPFYPSASCMAFVNFVFICVTTALLHIPDGFWQRVGTCL